MNVQTTMSKAAPFAPGVPNEPRPPLTQVRCLLPIWGYAYVRQFLEVGLPTWLAPGNLPALASELPTEFVLLTSREDEIYLRAHPGFARLCAVCKTTIHYVDHLITGNNYSTTITLAYTEAMRAVGDAVTDTCFFFLVSDYVVADGSFRSVIKRIREGRSSVLVGNFQVVEEEAMPWLVDRIGETPTVVSLQSRDMMQWALSHLHPATIANTVNYPLTHNDHTNRLFWRVDNQTLIGRFYLMHMIAIRPEISNFVIGSSCDYSFIPEMCPSNDVEIITDSDDYFVVEMQPRSHEATFLRVGPQNVDKLATVLSEWTTARHRENSQTTVIFHGGEIPKGVEAAVAEADEFTSSVNKRLSNKPRPHRGHPYWTGAVAAFNEASGAKLSEAEWRLALGLPNPALQRGWLVLWVFERLRFALFGQPPHVRPWHPRYPDNRLILTQLEKLKLDERSNLLLVSDVPTIFTVAFADGGDRVVRLRNSVMVKQPQDVYEPLLQRFDMCLIEINESEFQTASEVLDRIAPMMKDGGTILVSVASRRTVDKDGEFQQSLGLHSSRLIRPSTRSAKFFFVRSSVLRAKAFSTMIRLAMFANRRPALGAPLLALLGLPLSIACYVGNRMSQVVVDSLPRGRLSSALVAITVDASTAKESHLFSSSRVVRERSRLRRRYPPEYKLPARRDIGVAPGARSITQARSTAGSAGSGTTFIDPEPIGQIMTEHSPLPSEGTREPQYNRCLDIKEKQGLTSLGLMTNQVWEDDPRRLTFLLSRYKFVSKMLNGKKMVGELGCGDAFGTRIVMQEVKNVVVYDFDPVFIEDIRTRRSETWPVEAHFHDIIEAKLPNVHDGIYSLDVIEHIARTDEDKYITNLCASLSADGVLIIGSPSLESQTYASPPSKAGHINCKSGSELKALLGRYFDNVFLFSMNDEVVHTGYAPMAHYLFAVCCQKKHTVG